ncbi:MAG: helix-turn-helix domain-containing protein [Planctomycetales bacterium]|nr:helix-turn-helix domain-containing protein [Planctomycetales bacterium]MBN8627915.1 helix-turn-helix domain-containing protein [Planctomycetota bacterium]
MNTEANPPRLLLSVKEAAKQLSVCERTLFTLTKTGQLAAVRIRRRVCYLLSDIQKFVESQRTQALE